MKRSIKKIHNELLEKMKKECEHYQLPDVSEHMKGKAQAILSLESEQEAQALAEVLLKKNTDNCLGRWAKGETRGPKTPELLEKQAKEREKFAKMKYDNGKDEEAAKDRKAAEAFRAEAEALRRR
jgi:hypothetical protein